MTTVQETLSPRRTRRAVRRGGWRVALARRLVHGRLATIDRGRIEIVDESDGSTREFGRGDGLDLRATLRVRDGSFYTALLTRGSVGAAEAWMDGAWDCDDLVALVRIMVRNRAALDGLESGLVRIAQPLLRLFHRRNANTRDGSRLNIAAHYDLGDELFELFLDPTLTYSCGYFERDDATMEEASIRKIDMLCKKLDLRPRDHLLEIGTGWGAFALHAAREYGCRVTTTTISRAQHDTARRRIAAAGLEDRVTLLLQDYRDLTGRYDKLVSVEMIEAVGREFLPGFLRKCAELLTDDGVAAIQAILIADQHYERAVREVDFIKRYVFPGSFIPSTTAILNAATASSDLRLVDFEDIGPHYATTLARWRARFHENLAAVRALGCSEQFVRLWEYYLGYCEGGFAERFLGVGQLVFARPGARPSPRRGREPLCVP